MLQTIQAKAAKRKESGEGGFTLIELMVVVLIIAILLAIAIPTFLGAQNKAKDRAAQSGLRNTLTNGKTIYADSQDFTTATPAALNALEPGVVTKASGTNSAGPKDISVVTTKDSFVAAAKSDAGDCFYVREQLVATATIPVGVSFAKLVGAATCDAATLPAVASFKAQW